jgi:hypothetical protein
MSDCCIEPWGSMKGGEMLGYLSDYCLLKDFLLCIVTSTWPTRFITRVEDQEQFYNKLSCLFVPPPPLVLESPKHAAYWGACRAIYAHRIPCKELSVNPVAHHLARY